MRCADIRRFIDTAEEHLHHHVHQHLASCQACRTYKQRATALDAILSADVDAPPSSDFDTQFFARLEALKREERCSGAEQQGVSARDTLSPTPRRAAHGRHTPVGVALCAQLQAWWNTVVERRWPLWLAPGVGAAALAVVLVFLVFTSMPPHSPSSAPSSASSSAAEIDLERKLTPEQLALVLDLDLLEASSKEDILGLLRDLETIEALEMVASADGIADLGVEIDALETIEEMKEIEEGVP